MNVKFEFFQNALKKKLEQASFNQIRSALSFDQEVKTQDHKHPINFTSKDFLNLSDNSFVKKKVIQYVLRLGSGSSHIRPIPEHMTIQKELEEKISTLNGYESTLLFSSYFLSQKDLLKSLLTPRSQIFIDKHCKSTFFEGAHEAKATCHRFDHNDLEHLIELLETAKSKKAQTKIIAVESLYHFDGDFAPLEKLSEIANTYNAILYADDSYALGVYGDNGMGLCQSQFVDIVFSSFGKSCGSYGSFISASELVGKYLLQLCPTFSTNFVLPPAVLGAIDALLDLIPDSVENRQQIDELSTIFRSNFQNKHPHLLPSNSHLLCFQLDNKKESQEIFKHLSKANILASLVHPPKHLKAQDRLRFIISSKLQESEIYETLDCLEKYYLSPILTNS